MKLRSILIPLAAIALATLAQAQGVLTVTSPEDGDFVGSSTTISFRIANGNVQVRVRAVISESGVPGGATTTLERLVTPDQNGDASGSMTWSPSQSFPEGPYDILVTATETGNTYNSVSFSVTLDRIEPRFFEYGPLSGTFINNSGISVTANIDEPNIREWRVTVNDADLPNNTGSTNTLSVFWDPTNIELDGEQTVKIIVTDLADNTRTQTITVTLDRSPPNLNPLFPRTNQKIVPGSTMPVVVSVQDISANAVDVMAVSVEIHDLNGNFLKRVPRLSYTGVNSTTSAWTGRIKMIFPGHTQLKLVVTATDKAGNVAVPQEVIFRLGR